MRRRMLGLVGALLAAAVPLEAYAPPPAGARTPAASESIQWRGCGGSSPTALRPHFECASLDVPLDYAVPAGPTIALAVTRVRARRRARRIGSLVVNPGGPGASGIAYLRAVADTLPGALRDRFDLVSFDPRGTGGSGRVLCGGDIDPLFDQDFSPHTLEARAALIAAVRAVVASCVRDSGWLLPHVSTLETARDLDRLRAALGDRELTYVGASYGTYLGTVYASRFPRRVRALVLDGAIDPVANGSTVALAQARGFEHALDDFLVDCAEHRRCAFHHGGRPGPAYDALRARAARVPLATLRHGDRTVNETRFDAAVLAALYAGRNGWPSLAQALADAEHGNAATLLSSADAIVGRGSAGVDHPTLDAFWAIACLDGPPVGDLDSADRLQSRARAVAPRLGAFIVNFTLACSIWPVSPVPPGDLHGAVGAPAILVIGTTDDPATPLAGARSLTRLLDNGRLLVAEGEQHTSFIMGNHCVDRAVTRYLVDRILPRRGLRC